MNSYFDLQGLPDSFQMFSMAHVLTLALIFFVVYLVYRYRAALRSSRANYLFRMNLAGLLLLCEVALESWQWLMGGWTLDYSLPLHLCSISLILSIIMLLNKNYALFEFTYLAGLGGALQAILTPDLGHYAYPHFRTFEFFIGHGAVVVACFFMVFVERYKPTLASIWRSMVALNIVAVLVYGINTLTGGNYMFISHKPSTASLIDLLGPWPWYILSLEGVALVMFFLLYVPFAFAGRNQRESA